jgi:hypothetical protein
MSGSHGTRVSTCKHGEQGLDGRLCEQHARPKFLSLNLALLASWRLGVEFGNTHGARTEHARNTHGARTEHVQAARTRAISTSERASSTRALKFSSLRLCVSATQILGHAWNTHGTRTEHARNTRGTRAEHVNVDRSPCDESGLRGTRAPAQRFINASVMNRRDLSAADSLLRFGGGRAERIDELLELGGWSPSRRISASDGRRPFAPARTSRSTCRR